MDRRAKVELFEQIRREHELGGASIRTIARKFHVHRRLVRQALASAIPPERAYSQRACPKLDPVKPFIDAILQADRQAPRKQRHTAQHIYRRICQEWPQYPVGRSRVNEYVRQRKQELGLLGQDTFVPQSYSWGVERQVDWYEAFADLSGERTKLYIFCLRSIASGARRRPGSLPSVRTGALKPASARRAKDTKKAAWRARPATFGGTIWFSFPLSRT